MKKTLLVSVLFLFVFCGVAFSQNSVWKVTCSVPAMSDGYNSYPFFYEGFINVEAYPDENYWWLYDEEDSSEGEMWGLTSRAVFYYENLSPYFFAQGIMKIGKKSAKAKVMITNDYSIGFGTCKMKLSY